MTTARANTILLGYIPTGDGLLCAAANADYQVGDPVEYRPYLGSTRVAYGEVLEEISLERFRELGAAEEAKADYERPGYRYWRCSVGPTITAPLGAPRPE